MHCTFHISCTIIVFVNAGVVETIYNLSFFYCSNISNDCTETFFNRLEKKQLFKSLTYAFLAVAIVAKGHRPDFNNGPGGYSNNGRILASSIYSNLTRIMVQFWPPGVYWSLTRIMVPPQAIPFCIKWRHSCSSLLLRLSWLFPYLANGHRLDFNNGK